MKPTKQSAMLPDRRALTDLAKTKRTILDYGKRTPLAPLEPKTNMSLNMLNPRKGA